MLNGAIDTDAMPSTVKTVLVTGAFGFVGTELLGHLTSAGYKVIAASRSPANMHGGVIESVVLPSPETATDLEFDRLLSGVDHVVHLAGIAHTQLRQRDAAAAYHNANFLLTERLAKSAVRSISGKFVFVSSIRAQCGGFHNGVAVETDRPHPTDDYGRTKLQAENAIATILVGGNFSILRPMLVYGAGVRGNMGALIRLAKLPLPLPFASLRARRSLLSRSSLCRAIVHCLREPATDRGTFIVADKKALTPLQIIAALRAGLGRGPGLFHCPPALLGAAAKLLMQSNRWETLSNDSVACSRALEATGWTPVEDPFEEIQMAVKYLQK